MTATDDELAATDEHEELVTALVAANAEARAIRDPRSPAAAQCHAKIDELLDAVVGR